MGDHNGDVNNGGPSSRWGPPPQVVQSHNQWANNVDSKNNNSWDLDIQKREGGFVRGGGGSGRIEGRLKSQQQGMYSYGKRMSYP